ncbi:biotin-dependent carboxyltransferase family protein [Trinickia violacea]|uniref:Biotin-dependent carboxyltransferase family protein n=1 Tax=Trinickia violacea TaxID=2571746 RepID=A0A4P8IZC7_9BURK|nr:biotin-dependent carboxyltransferase family protein [Trinickia violacea]QCP53807.1 biotin-dependent carboxyltransferase family protein [Trinickia violacea]
MSIEVLKPGALTTFQDLGRTGYQQFGIPVNGVMDERAHRLANLLAGNDPGDATLEITLIGPTLRMLADVTIALCGADLEPMADGEAVPLNEAVPLPTGTELSFGQRRSGVRAYLAVRGGFALEPVMGSCSTFVRGGYGGHRGRPLRKGDVIAVRERGASNAAPPSAASMPTFPNDVIGAPGAPLRVIAGREWPLFSADAQCAFANTPYRIGAQSDRMGYRLEGEPLALGTARQMMSEAVGFGTIQVPSDGQPIVLMADRQTTGGYPKIAHVCAVDLPRLAQTMPGESVRFEMIGLDEAQRLLAQQERAFAKVETRFGV